MIVRHQGVSIASGKNVTGYAVHMDGKSYIFFDNGCRIQVKASSIVPVEEGLVDAMELMPVKEGVHSLYCLGLSEQLLCELKKHGVRYLEDLLEWKDEDYNKVKGLGSQKRAKIQRKLEEYGLVKNNITQNPESYFNGATETVDSEYFEYDFYIQPNEIILFTQAYLLEPYANHFQPTIISKSEIQNILNINI